MLYKDVFGNDVDGNGKPLGKPPSTKQTPEERAESELIDKLGFVIQTDRSGYIKYYTMTEDKYPGTEAEWILWSLALRQRVELNKLNESK